MRDPCKKLWWWCGAILVAVAVPSLAAAQGEAGPPGRPVVIDVATDCWQTQTDPPTEQQLETLPAGFFGTDSKAVPRTTVQLKGKPLPPEFVAAPYPEGCGCPEKVTTTVTWLDRHGNVAKSMRHAVKQVVDRKTDVDTCVRRTTRARLTGKGPVTVTIQLVALSLESTRPLEVPFKDGSTKGFDLLVTQSKTVKQRPGKLTLTPGSTPTQGKVKLGSLHIDYDVEFRGPGGPFFKRNSRLTLSGTLGDYVVSAP